MSIVDEIKQTITGVDALADWLGDGGVPVVPMLAEFRAQRCVSGNDGKPCLLNKHPRWWEHSKTVIAAWVRKQIELKTAMNLTVSSDDKLHLCSACGCTLTMKVHVPLSHIRKHTPQETLDKMPAFCWIKSELKGST